MLIMTVSIQNTLIIKMQAKAQIISNSITTPSYDFKCGCGAQFKSSTLFRQHSLSIHNGDQIQNSTHFLSILTQVVLPAQKGTQQQKGTPEIPHTARDTEQTDTITKTQFIKVPNHQQARLSGQYQRKQSTKKIKGEHNTSIIPFRVQKSIEWNGFKLVKNKSCTNESFYCGNCHQTFPLTEQFITHCIEICQQLNNAQSSHFITCSIDATQEKPINLAQTYQRIGCQTNAMNEVKHTMRLNNVLDQVYEIDPIQEIYNTKFDHRSFPFFCGFCNKIVSCSQSIPHIYTLHSQVIQPSSSHVILRILNSKLSGAAKVLNFYISCKKEWINSSSNYYCPCNPVLKMNMQKLTKHVMEIHKGISPIYVLTINHQQSNGLIFQPNLQLLEIKQAEAHIKLKKCKKNQDPIQFISKRQIDHKEIMPIYCRTCNILLTVRTIYHHISYHLQNEVEANFSHVILRITTSLGNNRFVYISPDISWWNEKPIYYCPCMPNKKMKMSQLLLHHIQLHNFISPLYNFCQIDNS